MTATQRDPSVAPRAYLDHAATSPLRPAAAAAMDHARRQGGNPSSLHGSGRGARALVEDARERLAAAVGAQPAEVVLTSGGTEADNLAVLGALRARPDRPVAVVGALEHPAVAEAAAFWARSGEVRVAEASGAGSVAADALAAAVDDRTAVVSLMWANNETGALQPVEAAVAAAHAHGAWVHSDAVQALGHVAVDFAATGLDLLSVSAHKVGGPVGVGALVVRREVTLVPVGFGGGQERGLRSGTVDVVGAVGFAAAVEEAVADLAGEAARLGRLRERALDGIRTAVPDAVLNSPDLERCLPSILNVGFPGCEADALLMLLDRAGIDTSTGSACTAGVAQPSDVLLAMGRTDAEASSALRFSLGWSSTAADVDRLLAALPEAVTAARAAAGFR